eukprot:11360066-Heterocapsa_arctica.AAC.1
MKARCTNEQVMNAQQARTQNGQSQAASRLASSASRASSARRRASRLAGAIHNKCQITNDDP